MFSHSLHDLIQTLESKYGISEVALSPADMELAAKIVKDNGLNSQHMDALVAMFNAGAKSSRTPIEAKFMLDKFGAQTMKELAANKVVGMDMDRVGKPKQYWLTTNGYMVAAVAREKAFMARSGR